MIDRSHIILMNRLEDLVAHEDIVSILTKLIDSNNLPHLLLYGPPGTGKVCYVMLQINAVLYGMESNS